MNARCLFIIRELAAYIFCHECTNVCFIERQSLFRLNSLINQLTYFAKITQAFYTGLNNKKIILL